MGALQLNTVGTTGSGERLLVLVHGYGADEYDLAPLTSAIDPTGRFFTICPRGPHSVMGFGAGWYERGDDGTIDPVMFLASVDAIDTTIDNACADGGFERSQAVVIGFSQGGAMTLAGCLRSNGATRPAAMACLSGMLQEVEGLEYDLGPNPGGDSGRRPGEDFGRRPGGDSGRRPGGVSGRRPGEALPAILVHHGTLDPLVPIDRGHRIRDTLIEHGIEHTYREYPMQHEISPQSVYDLRDWLAAQ